MRLVVRTQLLLARARLERGTSAVEYGLLVALIAAIIVVGVVLLGSTLNGIVSDVRTAIS